MSRTCGDGAKSSKHDANAKCKHILAVMNCIPNGQVETACFLERRQPKLDELLVSLSGHLNRARSV